MAGSNLATPTKQDNPAFDRVWAELGFAVQTPLAVERGADEIDEQDDTDWQDFLGYHDEVRR